MTDRFVLDTGQARSMHVEKETPNSCQVTPSVDTGSSSRKRGLEGLLDLMEEWMADESGYEERTWPELKNNIEANRMSYRKRFSD